MKCNQCEYLFINGVGCHETGCPNTSKPLQREVRRHYIGIRNSTRTREAFTTSLPPSPHYYPEYAAVIGPFKTKRAAVWGAKNPCNWSHVSDAEILSKGAK
jgi:hypothetical protein